MARSPNASKFIHECMRSRIGKSNGYGILFEDIGDNKYRLFPSLYEEFEKVFIVLN